MTFLVVAIFLVLIYIFYQSRKLFRTEEVAGGFHQEILLPHSKSVELYHNPTSSASQKVRTCLHEAGINFLSHEISLPSSGSYESKFPWYLRINPAGTVPVLIHGGHPVYESHEQIRYIDEVLRDSQRPSLRPSDPEKLEIMNKWVEKCSMVRPEIMATAGRGEAFSRVGNVLPAMTIPVFAANMIHIFSIPQTLGALVLTPFMSEKFFPLVTVGFKMFGLRFLKFPPIAKFAGLALPSLTLHLRQLEADLVHGGGPWICGEQFTLADVSWIPVLERMEVARFWDVFQGDVDFQNTCDYWVRIQNRASYQKGKAVDVELKLEKIKSIIDDWKKNHSWFRKQIYHQN